jgi:hypothetical protein
VVCFCNLVIVVALYDNDFRDTDKRVLCFWLVNVDQSAGSGNSTPLLSLFSIFKPAGTC